MLIESDGDLFLWRPGKAISRLTETDAAEEAPSFSPDGGKVAFVRDADLYLLDLADGSEHALTSGGEDGVTLNGTTDWVYMEEIWNRSPIGYWWSPDGAHIVYYHFDETPVGEFTLLPDPVPVYPTPKVQRYPKAGTANPNVRLGVLDVASAETRWLDTEAAPERGETYLARVHWAADSATVDVERLNRDQTDLDLLSCDPATGACRTVLQEHADTWVDLGTDTTLLPDGRILWASARTGWRHLYLYSAPGTRDVGAHPAADLRRLGGRVRRPRRAGRGDRHRLRHRPARRGDPAHPAGAVRRLERSRCSRRPGPGGSEGPARGWHGALVALDGRHWLHSWSDADHPGWQRLETASGETVAKLPATPPAFDPAALPQWTFFQIPGPDGVDLPAAMLVPSGVDPEGSSQGEPGAARLPVIMYHYG